MTHSWKMSFKEPNCTLSRRLLMANISCYMFVLRTYVHERKLLLLIVRTKSRYLRIHWERSRRGWCIIICDTQSKMAIYCRICPHVCRYPYIRKRDRSGFSRETPACAHNFRARRDRSSLCAFFFISLLLVVVVVVVVVVVPSFLEGCIFLTFFQPRNELLPVFSPVASSFQKKHLWLGKL